MGEASVLRFKTGIDFKNSIDGNTNSDVQSNGSFSKTVLVRA